MDLSLLLILVLLMAVILAWLAKALRGRGSMTGEAGMVVCPRCHRANVAHARFCASCGLRVR